MPFLTSVVFFLNILGLMFYLYIIARYQDIYSITKVALKFHIIRKSVRKWRIRIAVKTREKLNEKVFHKKINSLKINFFDELT